MEFIVPRKSNDNIHPDILFILEIIYKYNGFICKNLNKEIEGKDYCACSFELRNQFIRFRIAKITPSKAGQFVTLWKRIDGGSILPFDMADRIDSFIVSVRSGKNFGLFMFPKNVLHIKGFVSKDGIGGKRAMRLYPPWDIALNQQAQKTQKWQLMYFVEILPNIDIIGMKRLFCFENTIITQ